MPRKKSTKSKHLPFRLNGAALRRMRKAMDWTTGDVAYELDVAANTVTYWEHMKRVPSQANFDALCRLFECEPMELIFHEDYYMLATAQDVVLQAVDSEDTTYKDAYELVDKYLQFVSQEKHRESQTKKDNYTYEYPTIVPDVDDIEVETDYGLVINDVSSEILAENIEKYAGEFTDQEKEDMV